MRAQVRIASAAEEMPTSADQVDNESAPFAVRGSDAEALSVSPWTGSLTFGFPGDAVIHRGIFNAVRQQLEGRQPMAGISGPYVHVSFALEDDSLESRRRLDAAAELLQRMMPNSELCDVAVVRADFGRHSGHLGGAALTRVETESDD